jgi:phenylalanyl-tRNA synthetase alpha chain
MKEQLEQLKKKALAELRSLSDAQVLRDFEVKYLGRHGELTMLLRRIKDVVEAERPLVGQLANQIRQDVEKAIQETREHLGRAEVRHTALLDMTWPGRTKDLGHLHPLTQFQRKIEDIFLSMGFEVLDGPEMETPKYNFDLLNIPKDHPARDVWDTYYVEKGLVLRTHTSPMQLRAMESRKPPVRLLIPGRAFRREATDASHETTFYQYEGLVIDKCISAANLLDTLQRFFQTLFGQQVKIKARSSFFPFTEPSLEIAMSCLICGGTGCNVCKKTGWLEMLGAGMVHPQVLKNMKIDPEEYSGFAFGGGIERLMMLYYGINDIRLSYGGDLRFLEQF